MKLEGRVIGPWSDEFDRAWRDLVQSLGSRTLCLDLRDVAYLDGQGRSLLSEICRISGADILADSPLTKYFVEEAKKNMKKNGKEGT